MSNFMCVIVSFPDHSGMGLGTRLCVMYIIFRPELLMSDLQVADKAQDVHPWRPVL